VTVIRRRQSLIFITAAYMALVGMTLLRLERVVPTPVALVAIVVMAAVVAVLLTEHRLPRLSVAALRSRDDDISPWRAALLGLLLFLLLLATPFVPWPELGDGWASEAWSDVLFLTV
jgi:hypothetical protein